MMVNITGDSLDIEEDWMGLDKILLHSLAMDTKHDLRMLSTWMLDAKADGSESAFGGSSTLTFVTLSIIKQH